MLSGQLNTTWRRRRPVGSGSPGSGVNCILDTKNNNIKLGDGDIYTVCVCACVCVHASESTATWW